MKFGVIEIGSSNTKAFVYNEGRLNNLGSKWIAFKNNYKTEGKLLESDIKKLYDFIKELKKDVTDVYAFGTSIFRNISEEEKTIFTNNLKADLDVDFRVVSADEESTYTVMGVINGIDYIDKMAVVIGGGGSTELAIIENKEIIKRYNFNFGAMDITDKFPELKGDTVSTDFNDVLDYTNSLIGDLNESVNALVLAGGDYIYYYEKANYKMDNNFLYNDDKQPYLLNFDKFNEYDNDMLSKSFDKIKSENPGMTEWWNGARGMRFCMNAIARKLNAKYIIPTRINMLIGLTDEILRSK